MQTTWASLTALAVVLVPAICVAQELPSERVIGKLEVVATFNDPMPTGVTVRRRRTNHTDRLTTRRLEENYERN